MIFFEKKIEKKVEKMLKIAYFQRFFDDFQHLTPNVRHRWRRENIGATKELNLWI